MTILRLRDEVGLAIHYTDDTPYGSAVSGLIERLIARTCAPLGELLRREGPAAIAARSAELVGRVLAPQALGRLFAAPDRLRPEALYPDAAAVRPAALRLHGLGPAGRHGATIALPAALARELAAWTGAWSRGATRPRDPAAAALWDALVGHGALTAEPAAARALGEGVRFIGHATALVAVEGVRALFDPFVVPRGPLDGADARPFTCAELRPDAVFITHSHPDHYDLGALLRFGADVPIYVPEVPRESLLAVDMRARLVELGFRRVQALAWRAAAELGPLSVRALPFHGEQPTDAEVLHPEARNAGNIYVVDGPCGRIALLADAGRDGAGDTRTIAADERARGGAVDVVFGGYRAWNLRPAQYLFTSVARYLLLVPRSQWGAAQQIMNDAGDLLDTAAAFGARTVVPYANGGAPWYARIGLGPREQADSSDPNFDPPPQTVAALRDLRGTPELRVVPLAPGARLEPADAGARRSA